jgi:hypothetical protein
MIQRSQSVLLRWGALLGFWSTIALAQVTVDATGPIRDRARTATSGHVGSIGRKLQVQITIEVTGVPDVDGSSDVTFILTNSGKKELLLPVSPNPADLEPADSKSYSVKQLSLYITSDQKQEQVLTGGARLYGNRTFAGTLVSLAPGESIRVLARVAFPNLSGAEQSGSGPFVAHAVLNDRVTSLVDGQIFENTQEFGSAISAEYSPKSLFRSPR